MKLLSSNLSVFVLCFFCFSSVFSQKYTKANYQDVLKKTTRFYGAQRCGDGGNNWILKTNPEGNDCHWMDGPSYGSGINLQGGWEDAGDHLKFTITIAWSAYALLKSYDGWPASHQDVDDFNHSGKPNGIPDILDEVKYATDYLIKCHINSNTFIRRVGGNQDHDYFYTSPKQTKMSVAQGGGNRPVYNEAKGDVAGIAAAALGLMAVHYKKYDSNYASTCISKGESIYRYALKRPSGTNDDFYPTKSYLDDFFCGAIELYRATGNSSYLSTANSYESKIGPHYWVIDWDNHVDLCRHSLVKAGVSAALNRWKIDVDSYSKKVTTRKYVNGLAYFSDWGSLRYATNAGFSAALFYTINKQAAYKTFALSQLDYVMGTNEYSRSFIIGYGTNPPKKPHHSNSYGFNDWPNTSNTFKYPLVGAVVGGPSTGTSGGNPGYTDDPNDYVGNEVTIDYNVGTVGLSAFAISQL